MSVEIFTREQFEEQALPVDKTSGHPLWKYIGLRGGEHAYLVKLPKNNIGIEVRSSVESNGFSAETGGNSIRCWIVDVETLKPMGSKINRWTNRTKGWGERTKMILRQLWEMGAKIVPCPSCPPQKDVDNRLRCFKVKKAGPNKGKLFLKCPLESCRHFEWFGEEESEVTQTQPVPQKPLQNERHGSIMPKPCPDCGEVVKTWQSRKQGLNEGRWFYSCAGLADSPVSKGCGFFQWADPDQSLTANQEDM
jgi:hypothetical protein